jgi:hypothetical protein
LKDNLGEQAAKRETGIALITGLQNNAQNMLAPAERQEKSDGIDELGPLQYQVTASDNRDKADKAPTLMVVAHSSPWGTA